MIEIPLAHGINHHWLAFDDVALGEPANGTGCDPHCLGTALGGFHHKHIVDFGFGRAFADLLQHGHARILIDARNSSHVLELNLGFDDADFAEGIVARHAGHRRAPDRG